MPLFISDQVISDQVFSGRIVSDRAVLWLKIQHHQQSTYPDKLAYQHAQFDNFRIGKFFMQPLEEGVVYCVMIQRKFFRIFYGKLLPWRVAVVICVQLSNFFFTQVYFFFCSRQKSRIESGIAIV